MSYAQPDGQYGQNALRAFFKNYTVLIDLCRESSEHVCDAETKARIQGVADQMRTFDLFFGASLTLLILRHADNLSMAL